MDEEIQIRKLLELKEIRNIIDEVWFVENDNRLYVDFTKMWSVKNLIKACKKARYPIVFEEYLGRPLESIVKDLQHNEYANEFILFAYENSKKQ